ncbi:hypothetical protein CLV86_2628 [Lacinutrix venerupis]|uniref:hypothetical protein n=1 Tax=Lacinutrix venerupis TaxID=1486034 RepID=UPI000EAF0B9F|nr:hypothetical protein [Lacinutrix venerupis]RLJ61605.1 hypothetical protein CLV86_2628 [Lacinutrix venerupis]
MEFKVLWFDDVHHRFEIFKNRAKQQSINITAVTNAMDGLKLLKKPNVDFDAIIIDGLFYTDDGKEGDNVNDDAFGQVAKFLGNLKAQNKIIPWFIYSGEPGFINDDNSFLKLFSKDSYGSKKVYDKNVPTDEALLFNDIKSEINRIPKTQLKIKYSDAFALFNNGHLSQIDADTLSNILIDVELENKINNDFLSLRKLIEGTVDVAHSKGLIPFNINKNNLNASFAFLCNKNTNYELIEPYFHSAVTDLFSLYLKIIQDASHKKVSLELKVEDYISNQANNYLFRSCLYCVLDLLSVFNVLFEKFDNLELPDQKWKELIATNLYQGKIDQDEDNNYFCGDYILSYKYIQQQNLQIGQDILITTEKENTSRTKNRYSKFAVTFKIA